MVPPRRPDLDDHPLMVPPRRPDLDDPPLPPQQALASALYADPALLEPPRRPELLRQLRRFVAPNEDPNTSDNLRSEEPDPVAPFVDLLLSPGLEDDEAVVLLLLKVYT
eukprot:49520-Chlamydomonas_euryale.AAC.1